MSGTTLSPALPYHYPPPLLYQSCFLPSPPLDRIHLACHTFRYLSFEADGAEKWRGRSFNLAYLPLHTFSSLLRLCALQLFTKLPSRLSVLSCCPLLNCERQHTQTYAQLSSLSKASSHTTHTRAHTHAHTPMSSDCPRGHRPLILLCVGEGGCLPNI